MQTATHAAAWIAAVSAQLQQRWPTVDPQRIEDLAADLWSNEQLRSMTPELAADLWVRPVSASLEAGPVTS